MFPSSYVNASLPLNDSSHLNDTMMTWSVVLGVSFLVMGLMPSEVGPAYPNNGFLPATEGGTPDCVQDPRDTFCLDPKKYPKERILYLLENKMFDVDSMLMDESRDSYVFESRPGSQPVNMYGYDQMPQTYEPPRQTYKQPHQTYKPPRQSYGPPPPPPSLPSNGYLPPRQNNFSTTSKPYHPPPPPPLPPPTKYSPPLHSPSSHTYGAAPYHYGTPATPYDNDGPYPRYRKATTPSSSYLTRYLPPPAPSRSPPKPQPWWRKIMRSSRRRQKRQASSELCPYDEDYIMPKAALNNKGTWMFLVNMEDVSPQYTQKVQTKKCIPGATCSGSCNVPNGFTTTCQQQYVQKRLVALDGSGSSLAQEVFWFPSCCLCKIIQDG